MALFLLCKNTKVIILFSIHKIRKKEKLGEMSHER